MSIEPLNDVCRVAIYVEAGMKTDWVSIKQPYNGNLRK